MELDYSRKVCFISVIMMCRCPPRGTDPTSLPRIEGFALTAQYTTFNKCRGSSAPKHPANRARCGGVDLSLFMRP